MNKIFVFITLFLITFISNCNISISKNNIGDKIVHYANKFIGTPYDRIPEGLYVKEKKLIIDDEIDCMYLVFRTIPLALADGNNKKAEKIACNKMFKHKCKLDKDGLVSNYEDRFDYSEDMIASSKWGKTIFSKNDFSKLKGSRMYKYFNYVKSEDFIKNKHLQQKVRNGDILFLYKDPAKRSKVNEAIGHLGILEVGKDSNVYLIHASGHKTMTKPQGKVKKVILTEYLKEMSKFVGIDILRI